MATKLKNISFPIVFIAPKLKHNSFPKVVMAPRPKTLGLPKGFGPLGSLGPKTLGKPDVFSLGAIKT